MSLFKTEPDYSHLPEGPENKSWCPTCKRFIDEEEVVLNIFKDNIEYSHDIEYGGCGGEVE